MHYFYLLLDQNAFDDWVMLGNLQRSLRPSSWMKGKGWAPGETEEGRGKKGKGRRGGGSGKEKEEKGKGKGS